MAKKNKKNVNADLVEHHKVLSAKWLKSNALNAQAPQIKTTLDADTAKTILGWTEIEDKGADYLLVDKNGKKVLCYNNLNNRVFKVKHADSFAQDLLNRNYAYNAESITIGTNGQVLSGQRRLVGLVFAEQLRTGPQSNYWTAYWDGPVTMDCVVMYNVDSGMHTTRTIDNTRPRTVADAFYADPELAKYKPDERKVIARMLNDAIRCVWQRTGYGNNMFHSAKTNAEIVGFRDRHPKLLRCVKHIYDEDSVRDEDGKVTRRITGAGRWIGNAGVAAGLMYLMAMGRSDGDGYRNPKRNRDGIVERSEKGLDFTLIDKAEEFWVMLASVEPDGHCEDADFAEFSKHARKVRKPVSDENKGNGYIYDVGSVKEKAAALVKAWRVWLSGEKPEGVGVFKIKFEANKKTGEQVMDEDPLCGGIDCGWKDEAGEIQREREEQEAKEAREREEAAMNGEVPDGEPTPEEIEAEADKIKEENTVASGMTDSGNLD